MLEWLKTILGDSYTEEIDKQVSAEIGKAFVSKADFDAKNEAVKTLTATVKERDGQLEELQKLEPEKLQAEIIKLQGENKTATAAYEEKLKAQTLESKIELRLIKEGAVNTKAVKALLDSEKISLDGENVLGLDEQLSTLKESETWAFKQPDDPGDPGGNPPLPGGGKDPAKMTMDEYIKYRNGGK